MGCSPFSDTDCLKPIYTGVDEADGDAALDASAERWEQRYPAIVKLWRSHWMEFVP